MQTRFSTSRADSLVRRLRKVARPIPEKLEGLAEGLENDPTHPLHKHYRGMVKFTDGTKEEQVALIFVSNHMMNQLNVAEKLFIDGIMKVKLISSQIFMCHLQFTFYHYL